MRHPVRFVLTALLAALVLGGLAAIPALGCDDDGGLVVVPGSAPLMTVAYGGGGNFAPSFAPGAGYGCGAAAPQQAVVVRAPQVVYQQAPQHVVVQQAPQRFVVQRAPAAFYGSSGGSFAPGVGGGGISAGRKVVIRNSQVTGIGGGGISAGRKVRIRNAQVGF
jgi:hypothetical protein